MEGNGSSVSSTRMDARFPCMDRMAGEHAGRGGKQGFETHGYKGFDAKVVFNPAYGGVEKCKTGGMKSGAPGSGRSAGRQSHGRRIGRPRRLGPDSAMEVRRLYFEYPYSIRALADMFEVSRSTVWRIVGSEEYLR